MAPWLAVCLVCSLARPALAQLPEGYVSAGLDALPNAPGSPVEVRVRLFVDEQVTPVGPLTLRFAGSLDLLGVRSGTVHLPGVRSENVQLVGSGLETFISGVRSQQSTISRPDPNNRHISDLTPFVHSSRPDPNNRHVPDLTPFVQEGYAEIANARADLRVGYSRIVWGRLDEVQPTDVVNPLDLARFFFEGRSEARIAVAMVRGRLYFGERANIDALVVPFFRRGRFDHLDEPSSPFNVEPASAPIERLEPAATLGSMQGGARVSATTGRLDWSVSAFRGFDAFGTYLPDPLTQSLVQIFPRYTMIGGDFETATGEWALRGEFAYFSGDQESSDGGFGFDRRAGQYHVSGTLLLHHEPDYTSASLVASADRTFGRERYRARAFGVYNVTEQATFVRTIATMELRANLALEGSIGWFFGSGSPVGRDVIGRFSDRDFLYARLKLHF